MIQNKCSVLSNNFSFYLRFLLCLVNLGAFFNIIIAKDFFGLVFFLEIAALSYTFILFLTTKNFIYGATYAFFHFLAGSIIALATAKYHFFHEISKYSIDYYLLFVSLCIVGGLFPFSFIVSYCNSKIMYPPVICLQILATKLPFIILLKVFPNIEYLDKILLLFLGVLTVIYAATFIAEISIVSILVVMLYVSLSFILAFFDNANLSHCDLYSTAIGAVAVLSAVIIVIFYKNEEPRKMFAYTNTIFAGLLSIATAYLNFLWVTYLLIAAVFFTLVMLLIGSKKIINDGVMKLNLEIFLTAAIKNCFTKLLNSCLLFNNKKIMKLKHTYWQKYNKSAFNIQKFFNKTGLQYLQIDSIECNILLALLLITLSSFF